MATKKKNPFVDEDEDDKPVKGKKKGKKAPKKAPMKKKC